MRPPSGTSLPLGSPRRARGEQQRRDHRGRPAWWRPRPTRVPGEERPAGDPGAPGSDYSAALGINGSSATSVGCGEHRYWKCELSAPAERLSIVALGPLPGDSSSVALAINHPGKAVGYSSGPTGVRAVVWTRAGAIRALPMLSGCDWARGLAINDLGDIAGICDTVSGPRAVLWEGGAVQDLGTLPGHGASEALSINANGVIVGSSGDPEASAAPCSGRRAAAPSRMLGTLPGGASSRALAISNRRRGGRDLRGQRRGSRVPVDGAAACRT